MRVTIRPVMRENATAADLRGRIKQTLVDRLKLEIDPSDIGDSDPLFGEGLGLDSIDALELVLGIEQEFGVKIEDEEVGAQALASVESLADFVVAKQELARQGEGS